MVEPVQAGWSRAAETHAASAPDVADGGEIKTEPPAQSPDRRLARGWHREEQLVVLPPPRGEQCPLTFIGMGSDERAGDGERTSVRRGRDNPTASKIRVRRTSLMGSCRH